MAKLIAVCNDSTGMLYIIGGSCYDAESDCPLFVYSEAQSAVW